MPQTLQDAAFAALTADCISDKLALSQHLETQIAAGALEFCHPAPITNLDTPGRPARPELVGARELHARKLGSVEGRAVLLHAVAHIEFNAINLACDAIYRFPGLPVQYYRDWASVAADEARHFALLQTRLQSLGFGYGDFPAHNGLWDMAKRTQHDLLTRMALVPRLLEARGLDVTPGMISKLRAVGDLESVRVLEIILSEEVRHVAIGSVWFAHACAQRGVDVGSTFLQLLRTHAAGMVRGPFNRSARLAAGFSAAEVDALEDFHADKHALADSA